MLPQQYCLRWRYHHSNLQTMFSQLLEREAFCDVTLACEGRTIKAHKIVLSACSTYFETILSQYEEKDPILIMKDVKYVDIKCLVEFMYKGEINVEHVSNNQRKKKTKEQETVKLIKPIVYSVTWRRCWKPRKNWKSKAWRRCRGRTRSNRHNHSNKRTIRVQTAYSRALCSRSPPWWRRRQTVTTHKSTTANGNAAGRP